MHEITFTNYGHTVTNRGTILPPTRDGYMDLEIKTYMPNGGRVIVMIAMDKIISQKEIKETA